MWEHIFNYLKELQSHSFLFPLSLEVKSCSPGWPGNHYTAKDNLIFLDHGRAPLCSVYGATEDGARTLYVLGKPSTNTTALSALVFFHSDGAVLEYIMDHDEELDI